MSDAAWLLSTLESDPGRRHVLDLSAAAIDLSGLSRALRRSLERHVGRANVHSVRDLLRRDLAAIEVDGLRRILEIEATLRRPVATPARPSKPALPAPPDDVPRLPEKPTRRELHDWADAHHVEEALDDPITVIEAGLPRGSRLSPYVRWATFGDVLVESGQGTRLAAYLTAEQRTAARAYVEASARLVARALQDERRAAARRATPPIDPRLVDLWKAASGWRRRYRELTFPRGLYDKVQWQIEDDPPSFVLDLADVSLVMPLRGGRPPTIDGDDAALVDLDVALVGCDLLLDLLTEPERDEDRARLIEALGKPQWERDLAWLDRVTHEVADPAEDKNLLVWRIDHDKDGALQVVPNRGRPKKSGSGYVTRVVALRDVPRALRDDSADERVYDLLARWQHAPREAVLQAIRALVGHPRVLPPGRGSDPVPVRLTSFVLHLEPGEDGQMRLQPQLGGAPVDAARFLAHAERNAAAGLFAEFTGAEIRVADVREASLAFLRHWVVRQPSLPPEALPEVLRRLPSWMAHAPLTLAPSLHGQTVEADPRPLIRLDGRPDGLRVAVRVRPLPGGKVDEPGAGAPEVYTLRGSRVVHVRRDLDTEAHDVSHAVDVLGLPDTARTQPWDWWLPDAQSALGVVAALRDQPERFQVEWTGDRPTLRRAAKAADLRLTVRAARDWFGLHGSVEVDGVEVGLEALLDAAVEGHRFVQVSDGSWIGIEAALAERLAPAGATASDGKGRRLGPLHAPVLTALADAGALVDAPEDWFHLADRAREAQTLQVPVPEGLHATLRPYQVDGFRWLAALAHWAPGACLADDMGLGKTVQAIALLLHRAELGPALVVAPTSVLFNWERELARFAPGLQVLVHHGTERGDLAAATPGAVVLTSYGVLVRDVEALAAVRFGTVVVDESQSLKNPDSLRAKAARALQADFRVALSGTPIENHLGDLWSLMAFLAPGLLGTPAWFRDRFVAPIEGRSDARRRALLGRLVRPFVLRRTKAAVAPELPERVEVVHAIALSGEEQALYDTARRTALLRLTEEDNPGKRRFQVLAELQRLRQLACHPRLIDPGSPIASSKLHHAVRLLEDLREAGHRVLVFSTFVRHLELLREALVPRGFSMCALDGSTPAEKRRAEVDRFQAGEADVFLISLKAGGTGLNLTAATYVVHLDPWWNPAAEDQATDRAHRIGQEHAVTVYRLVAKGTIEERIVALHTQKRELADAILAGSDEAVRASTDDLAALLAEASLDVPDDEAEPVKAAPKVAPAAKPEAPALVPAPAARPSAPPSTIADPPPSSPEPQPPGRAAGDAAPGAVSAFDWLDARLNDEVARGMIKAPSAGVYRSAARRLHEASGHLDLDRWLPWLDDVASGAVDAGVSNATKSLARTLSGKIRGWRNP